QTRAAGASPPRGIRPPEAAEHQLLLTGTQADTVVADGHRDGVLVGGHPDAHRFVLGVVDGVGDEVAQDPLHPAGVDLGDDVVGGQVDDQLHTGLFGEVTDVVQGALDDGPQVDGVDGQFGDAGVVAGDL